jgi:3-deoxy-D-manno-octulosonate 8-phosphate phosphatase (KDO 8-P phosphatase)
MNVLAKFKDISTFVFDMDGVLTDSSLLLTEDGAWLRRMNTKDGFALQLAIKKGFNILVLTGSKSAPVRQRLNKLGIHDVHEDVKDKSGFLKTFIDANNLQVEEVLFMGDDVPDYGAMKLAGLPCCPSDAVNDIKEIAAYVSPFAGGMGCVRDVIEKVLKLKGKWELESNIAST